MISGESAGNEPEQAFGHYHSTDPRNTFIELFHLETYNVSELPGSRGIFAPRWSPDGRYIIAISQGGQKLMLYDRQTEKWRQVASAPPDFGYHAWSRDSAYVWCRSLGPELIRVRVSSPRPSEWKGDSITSRPRGEGGWSGLSLEGDLISDRYQWKLTVLNVESRFD